MKAWPEHVVALFEIAGRENTAELYRIATPIAAGTTSSAIIYTAPAWLCAAFPNVAKEDLDRFILLVCWVDVLPTHGDHARALPQVEDRARDRP
jgi:hypothetical protein